MGVVYRAIDRELGHEVALKVVRTRSADAISRLKSEFRARADLHHPNLIQLLDLVVTPEAAFFTMELIDTVDLLEWVWDAGEPGVPHRLATALAGVVSGLDALHAAGFVHFDVKPANILVDRSGRAVLADFGLSTAIRSADVEGAGTPEYMAPERHIGAVVTAASDLYSVGATIFEVITGSPRDAGDRPDDPFLALARRLMAADPDARPTARETLAALAQLATVTETARRDFAVPPFVGRGPQLEALAGAFASVGDDRAVAVHVHGPSGIGKTMLVRRFFEQLAVTAPATIVLRGRCDPYEQLAFSGVDRVVEDVARYLREGVITTDGLAPRSLAALVRLFPAIPWRMSRGIDAGHDDERALRLAGIAALRELIARAAKTRVVALWIDDLHWLDADSEEILAALADIPNTFTLYTYRSEDAARFAGARSRAALALALGDLEASELESAIRQVAPQLSEQGCRELAVAARGYPVLTRVLARLAIPLAEISSPAAVWNQAIDELPAAQRALFDAVSVAPGPVTATIAASAAGVEHGSPALRALEQLGVVARAPGRGALRVTPFHDQLRQMRLAHLDAQARAQLHRALARSHEQTASGDYEALIHHFHELGELDRAGQYAVLAGDRASESLAFGAAAAYYARALDCLPERIEPWELHRKIAECEANRGHGEAAGTHFELAADAYARTAGPGLGATRLSLRAAEQLLHCGRIPDGYRIMRDVLAKLRVRLPGSHRAAIAHSVVLRARLVLRGLAVAERTELDPEDELRMDALWMASTSLAHVNYALADVLLLHHVRAALDSGSSSRLLKALTYEAAAEVTLGMPFFDRRAVELIDRAEELVAATRDAYDRGWFEVSCATIAFFRAGWREAIARAEAAEHLLLAHGIGVAWERAVGHSYWLFALALTGDVAALEARRQIALEDALARRDRLAESHCRSGYSVLAWLFRDDPAGARRDRATVLGAVHWDHDDRARANRWPENSFGTPDYHALLADSHIDLYAGDARRAHERIESVWPDVERALLLRIQFVGVDLRFLRARCALAASRERPEARALVKLVLRERARIARDPSPVAAPYDALLGGLVTHAPELLDRAARGFDELDMLAHAEAARFRRGELIGGPDGARLCGQARERMQAAGIVCPERLVRMYAPAAP